MPAPSTLLRNKEITLNACSHDGQFVFPESQGVGSFGSGVPGGGGNYKLNQFAQFTACTGGSNGYIADIAPATSSILTLVNPLRCPLNMRPYLTRVDICVLGVTPWSCTSPTSIPFLSVQDTLGTPLVHAPWSALRSTAALTFPDSDVYAPVYVGAGSIGTSFGTSPVTTFTYSAATGVITLGNDIFSQLSSETLMVGTPVEIVHGTGKGQTAYVSACSSGAMTLNVAWGSSYSSAQPNSTNAFGTVAPDATSVIAIYWQPLSNYTNLSSFGIANGGGSPYTANIFDNGFNILGVAGAGQGNSRGVASNTTAGLMVPTTALNTAFALNTSIVAITNEPNMDGSVDMVCDDKLATAQINTGIQVLVSSGAGSTPLGSNVRVYVEGYWAL